MDIRRTVIFIGLAITSYLLILAWNNDYGQKSQVAPISQTAAPVQQDMPDTSDAAVVETPAVADAPAVVATAEKPAADLIRVTTDVLQITIDPRGGEVVEVLLPE